MGQRGVVIRDMGL